MIRLLISACLLGQPVRYDGRRIDVLDRRLERWRDEGRLIAICPETAGGLPTPRPPAEISGPDSPHARRVVDSEGGDVTAAFQSGAELALRLAKQHGLTIAILKEGSPSCGSQRIYDGTFSGTRIAGAGLTTQRLRAAGLSVFSENDLSEVEALIARLENNAAPGDRPHL